MACFFRVCVIVTLDKALKTGITIFNTIVAKDRKAELTE